MGDAPVSLIGGGLAVTTGARPCSATAAPPRPVARGCGNNTKAGTRGTEPGAGWAGREPPQRPPHAAAAHASAAAAAAAGVPPRGTRVRHRSASGRAGAANRRRRRHCRRARRGEAGRPAAPDRVGGREAWSTRRPPARALCREYPHGHGCAGRHAYDQRPAVRKRGGVVLAREGGPETPRRLPDRSRCVGRPRSPAGKDTVAQPDRLGEEHDCGGYPRVKDPEHPWQPPRVPHQERGRLSSSPVLVQRRLQSRPQSVIVSEYQSVVFATFSTHP